MNQMITVCPNCRQQLAVTAADLRVGQGFVRCGRCDKVFNALLSLAEDMPAPTEPGAVAHGTGSMPVLDEQDILPPLPGHEDDIPFGVEEDVEVVETHVTGQYRSLVMEGDEIRADDDEAPPPDADREAVAREIIRQATSQPIDLLLEEPPPARVADATPAPRSQPEPRPAPRPALTPRPSPPPAEEYFDADEALGNPRRPRGLWYAAAVVLALVLAGQYVHHNRQELVTVGWMERPIQAVYGLFGQVVDPPWDLALYDVAALGDMVLSGDARRLLVPAAVSVSKDARWEQPPPLVRVILSDRWGNVLATHMLAPGDWALGEAPARMQPGQRLDAEVALAAPERVSTFELDPCLRDIAGTLRCKDDPPP